MNVAKLRVLVLLSIAAFYVVMISLQEGIVDTADGVLHYQYARFVFEHPENAFNHWAKPIFTMLMAGPAQFGIKGIAFANALLIVFASHYVMKTVNLLGLSNAWLVGLMTGLGNSITYVVLGGLTEPLFIFSLSCAMYLGVSRRFRLMYLVLGASILIRPEAIVMVPILGLYGLLNGSWKSALFGVVIPLIVTILGVAIASLEWTWVFTGQPYQAESIYGSGTWLHYFKSWQRIAPYALLISAIAGVLSIPSIHRKQRELLMISLCGFGILFLHVLLWKFGKMGSAGLVRTLTTAIPALAISSGVLLHFLKLRNTLVVWLFAAFFLTEIAIANRFPLSIQQSELVAREMAEKLSARFDLENRKVAYQFATTAYYLNLDPFNSDQTIRLWSLDKVLASNSLNDGDILIWDNATGSREGKLSWERISSDPHATMLDSITIGQTTLVSFQISK